MNYFSKIKPVLNKLSELNVYDSLEVVRAYMQASADGNTNRAYVPGVNHSEANSVEVWFADFLIANIIKYCGDFPSQKSLRDVNPRHAICNKIEELHMEVSHKQMDKEVFVWLNSYIFNQFKILAHDNELRALYRYYYLYKTPKIRMYAEDKMGMPLEVYFKMSFFVYAIFAGKGRFHVKEDYFIPKRKNFDEVTKMALEYVLSQISKPLPELKLLCKNYCSYDEDKLFGFFSDAPHVKYPLIKDKGGYFCTNGPLLGVDNLKAFSVDSNDYGIPAVYAILRNGETVELNELIEGRSVQHGQQPDWGLGLQAYRHDGR